MELKRTGEEENRWYPLNKEPRYISNDETGVCVREGDETLNRSTDFQLCQSCLEPYKQNITICPHCGYDLQKAIDLREEELRLEKLNQTNFISTIRMWNIIYWYMKHPGHFMR